MKFKVIIPILNQPGYSELCIRFLYRTNAFFDLTIVDNGSLAHTKMLLKELSKEFNFTLITNAKNLGWATAVNQALAGDLSSYDFCVIVQNDCFLPRNFFMKTIEGISSSDPQAKVFIPKTSYSRSSVLMIDDEARQRFKEKKHSNKGLPKSREFVEEFLSYIYGDFQEYVLQFNHFKKLTFCNIIDSYCLVVNTQVFMEGIFFDTNFKTLGWVEKEWIERVLNCGYEPWILNNVFVHHHGNLTTDSNGFNYPKLLEHDEGLYKEKFSAQSS